MNPTSKCAATTAAGRPCSRNAQPGQTVCHVHAGAHVGRPSALQPDVVMRLLQALRAGSHVESAAQLAGIAARTFHRWMERGDPTRKDARDARYRRFREQVEQARAEAETRNVAIVAQAAQTDWKAAAWLLERTYPERWARASQRGLIDGPESAMAPGDPFAEVDELAAARRRHLPA